MINDAILAQASADCYSSSASWDDHWKKDDIHVFLRKVDDVDIVAFRGSIDAEDWLRDFRGWPTHDPILGWVHEGFMEGMEWIGMEVLPIVGLERPIVVTGHSLGAARALIFSAMAVALANGTRPQPIIRLTTFGTPRPGFQKLSNILRSGRFPITHYRNGPDPVADVPFSLWPFLPYQKPVQDIVVRVPPANPRDPFAWHHMPLYLTALT